MVRANALKHLLVMLTLHALTRTLARISYALTCHSYVIGIYTCMALVCTRMSLACHPYVMVNYSDMSSVCTCTNLWESIEFMFRKKAI